MSRVQGKEASLGGWECWHLHDRGTVSIGDPESDMSRIVPTTSDPGCLTSPPALRTSGCGACALSHTRSPQSPAPLCRALAAALDYSATPPSTVTYPPPNSDPAAPRSLSQGATAPGGSPRPPSLPLPPGLPPSDLPRPPAAKPLSLPPHQHLTQHNGREAGEGRGGQAGQLCVPAVRLFGDTVTAPAASSSSTRRQVQLGPRWPNSCRSRPLLPPHSVSRPRPRPPGEGAGPAPPPRAPFSAPGTRGRRLPPSRFESAPWLTHTSFMISVQPWSPLSSSSPLADQ